MKASFQYPAPTGARPQYVSDAELIAAVVPALRDLIFKCVEAKRSATAKEVADAEKAGLEQALGASPTESDMRRIERMRPEMLCGFLGGAVSTAFSMDEVSVPRPVADALGGGIAGAVQTTLHTSKKELDSVLFQHRLVPFKTAMMNAPVPVINGIIAFVRSNYEIETARTALATSATPELVVHRAAAKGFAALPPSIRTAVTAFGAHIGKKLTAKQDGSDVPWSKAGHTVPVMVYSKWHGPSDAAEIVTKSPLSETIFLAWASILKCVSPKMFRGEPKFANVGELEWHFIFEATRAYLEYAVHKVKFGKVNEPLPARLTEACTALNGVVTEENVPRGDGKEALRVVTISFPERKASYFLQQPKKEKNDKGSEGTTSVAVVEPKRRRMPAAGEVVKAKPDAGVKPNPLVWKRCVLYAAAMLDRIAKVPCE